MDPRHETPKASKPPPEIKIKGIRTNFPGADFDPLRASPAQLKEHFLPRRPDPEQTPKAFANWYRAMASRPAYPDEVEPRVLFLRNAAFITTLNRDVSQGSSDNWSGAVVRPRNFDSLALAQGRWIVPETPAPEEGEIFASSVWVGLDGYEPASRVMPQIGTGQRAYRLPQLGRQGDVDVKMPWWQFWMRDHPKGLWQVEIPLPIAPGDRFYGQVEVVDAYTVSFFLKNETANQAYAAYYFAELDYQPPDLKPVERQTAEWIVERPRIPKPGAPREPLSVPLADYGETIFAECNAASRSKDGNWQEFQLQRAHLIRMNIRRDPTMPGRLVSVPDRIGNDGLLMTYVGPTRRAQVA